ncbi:hypothetical protein GCM10010869_25280 [Mesorhizobium tianshanense]|nr:hypothetical protein GCM10010869_25280 [Mesorhizobium tianshanense]
MCRLWGASANVSISFAQYCEKLSDKNVSTGKGPSRFCKAMLQAPVPEPGTIPQSQLSGSSSKEAMRLITSPSLSAPSELR